MKKTRWLGKCGNCSHAVEFEVTRGGVIVSQGVLVGDNSHSMLILPFPLVADNTNYFDCKCGGKVQWISYLTYTRKE